ncbi:CHRD domain-containing protein [Sporichthya polymorpha]|uniref:CHRD domain-containing protein n=1 Tax=Sporichthya polymorpha TaxID=35751 RepID=UPI000362B722|nr:CHRD domain-containing protein [Sporichthya polymorpha]
MATLAGPTLAAGTAAPKSGFFELTPTAEAVPGGGDPRGEVRAFLSLDDPRNSVCYLITWSGLKGKVVAAHLHRGAAGKTGPHHVDLVNDVKVPGKRGSLADCVDADDAHGHRMKPNPRAVSRVLAKPERFYLNLHTTAYPDGARRAQLG